MNAEELEKQRIEKLEELIKSFDNITTNEAFNETQKQEALEDAEFEKRLEEIRNRNNVTKPKQEPKVLEQKSTPDQNPAFNEINEIINKRSEKNRKNVSNKNSSISYSLINREHIFLPTPIYLCEFGGKIVINIKVNHKGEVTEAYVNSSSASSNGCLIDHALEYAKASKFNNDVSKPTQLGSITFYFKGK